jgi:hypothetical protein
MKSKQKILTALMCAGAACSTFATEGGGSTFPAGTENFMAAVAPPPGVYGMEYLNHYSADRLNDNAGNAIPIPGGFKLKAAAAATRFSWVTNTQVLGGNLVANAVLPLVSVKVSAAGNSSSNSGIGDIVVGSGIAWHHSQNLHSVASLDFVLPTGSYDATRAANIGRNYLTVQPTYLVSWINPVGINADAKFTLNLNQKNKATNYQSGNELIMDYALGWGWGNGLVTGVGGYVYQQLSDDKVNGNVVPGSSGKAFSIGPSIKFDSGKGFFMTAKLEKEFNAKSRAQGTAFWVKATLPF